MAAEDMPEDSRVKVFAWVRQKVVDVRPDELRALGMAFLCSLLVLSSYYILRPIRDEMGVAGGVKNLPWLFTGTLVAMLVANALFAGLVVKFPRRRFIAIAYRFFIANILIFYLLLRVLPAEQQIWVGRSFFVWVSVFNLFVLSVFWAFMVDVFQSEQAKRLFGFIAVGGTLGAIFGAAITASLAKRLGPVNLLLISAVFLELSAQCVRLFPAGFKSTPEQARPEPSAEAAIGGSIWAGMVHAARSPFLLGISGYMLIHTISATLLYFQQASIAESQFSDRGARTAFFAQIDVWVNVLTIFAQAFVTGRLLKWFGVGVTLAVLPAVSFVGFAALGLWPVIAVLVIFQAVHRAANYSFSRPGREVLFTVLPREDKYKAKSFIDTFVYRAGDQIGAWSHPALTWLGLGLTGISFLAAPLAGIWLGLSLWLGRKQVGLARARESHAS